MRIPVGLGPRCIDSGNPVANHPLNTGLIGWWLGLPNNSGTTKLFCLKPAFDGTLTSFSSPFTNTSGWGADPNLFRAINFGATTQYVDFGNPSAWSGLTATTWSLWAKWSGTAGRLWTKWGSGVASKQAWLIEVITGGKVQLAISNGVSAYRIANGNGALTSGVWTHIAVTYSSGVVTVYHNGVDQGITVTNAGYSGAIIAGTSNCQLNYETDEGIAGRLTAASDLRAYSRALSASEIWGLYDQSLRGHPDTLRRFTPTVWSFGAPAAPSTVVTPYYYNQFVAQNGPGGGF